MRLLFGLDTPFVWFGCNIFNARLRVLFNLDALVVWFGCTRCFNWCAFCLVCVRLWFGYDFCMVWIRFLYGLDAPFGLSVPIVWFKCVYCLVWMRLLLGLDASFTFTLLCSLTQLVFLDVPCVAKSMSDCSISFTCFKPRMIKCNLNIIHSSIHLFIHSFTHSTMQSPSKVTV